MKNKRSMVTIAVVVSFLSFTSCGNTQKQTTENDHSMHEAMDHSDHEMTQATALSKEQTKQVLAAYLTIKNALVETNGELASIGAKTLLDALGDSQDELIKNLRMDAEHISGTQEPSHQREHFNTLSDNVYALVKDGSSTEETIYRQFCPMAMNNQGGYWLSTEKEIMNPYFGDKMLKCGSVKETIAMK